MIVVEFLGYLYPTKAIFLGGSWRYLVRVSLFTQRARAKFVCNTVLQLLECSVCWLTMSILALNRAGIKVQALHHGDSCLSLAVPITGVRDDNIFARHLKSFEFLHVLVLTHW